MAAKKRQTMKKILFVLFATLVSLQGNAQKGMQGIGGNVAMNVGFHDGGIGIGGTIKYQYYISNYFRLEPSFTYYAPLNKEDGTFNLAPMVNVHAFILSPGAVRPYVFLGAGYLGYKKTREYSDYYDIYDSSGNWVNYRVSTHKEEKSDNGLGFDGGLGLDYRITHSISLQIEGGILLGIADDDANGVKASVGICYNF